MRKAHRHVYRIWINLGVALLLALIADPARSELTLEDFWPAYVFSSNTEKGYESTEEIAWPFWDLKEDATSTDVVLRPFWNHKEDVTGDWFASSLWPVFTMRHREQRTTTTLLPLAYHMREEEGEGKSRFLLFPLYYSARDGDEQKATVVFPFYGNIKNWFSRDKIEFVLFPLYMHTERGDYDGYNVLWPLFGRGIGPEQDYWRIFPLWGRREDTGKSVSSFYLWPLFHDKRFDLDKEEPGHTFYFFPIYGFSHSSRSQLISVIPPFFNYQWSKDGLSGQIDAPWPFFQRVWGPKVDSWRVWPLYGVSQRTDSRYEYALWPLFQWGHTEYEDRVYEWRYLTPLWFERNYHYGDKSYRHNIDSWPLFTYDRNRAGGVHFSMINPLPWVEPEAFERSYGAFYTPIEYIDDGVDSVQFRFLWRLLEYQREEEGSFFRLFPLWSQRLGPEGEHRFTALTGLVGHEKEVDEDRYRNTTRLLWFIKIHGAWRERTP